MRKTVNLKDLKDMVNKFNRESQNSEKEYRAHRNTFLEQILMSVGAYSGYSHLQRSDMPDDFYTVGVKEQFPNGTWNFSDTDHTRIYYL